MGRLPAPGTDGDRHGACAARGIADHGRSAVTRALGIGAAIIEAAWLAASPGLLILTGMVVTGAFIILSTVLFARSDTPQSRLMQLIRALRTSAPSKPRTRSQGRRR